MSLTRPERRLEEIIGHLSARTNSLCRLALTTNAVICLATHCRYHRIHHDKGSAHKNALGLSTGQRLRPGGPALAGRRALAPRLYAALCGPMASSPRAGLALVWIGLGAGCRDGAAAAGGPGARGPPGPRAPAVCCAVWTYGQQSSCRPRLRVDRLGCGLSGRRGSRLGGPALAGRRALAPRLYAALCGPMASSPRAGLVWLWIGLGAWLSGRRGRGWGGPALAGRRALAPRLYAALCGPMASSPRAGLAWARARLGCV